LGSHHRVPRTLAAGILSAILLVGALAPPSSAQVGCDLKPVLREANINQGLPYPSLVRGKEVLARFYLSQPSCALAGTQMLLTDASLTVTGLSQPISGARPLTSLGTSSPIAAYNAVFDPSGALLAPALNSHPLFSIPGSSVTSSSALAFSASFSLRVGYSVNGVAKPAFTFTAVSRSVEKATSPLRVLGIPMGETSRSYSSQWTDAALPAAVAGYNAVDRIFPVADGALDMRTDTTGGGGVRYFIDTQAMVNAVPDLATGKFCGSPGNFVNITAQLNNFMAQYNSHNDVNKRAEKVQGLVDETILDNCADGMASLNGNESWVGVFHPADLSESRTGGVMAMEIGHNFGAVPSLRDDGQDATHAQHEAADVSSGAAYVGRSHNLSTNSYSATSRNVMRIYNPDGMWRNGTTFLDVNDWSLMHCKFGGPVSTECTSPAVKQSVVAQAIAVLVGSTDGTPAGTIVNDSFVGEGPAEDPVDSSDLRLVQRAAANAPILSNLGVLAHPVLSIHGQNDPNGDTHSDLEYFATAFPIAQGSNRIELWEGDPNNGGTLLYARSRNGEPQVTSMTASQEEDPCAQTVCVPTAWQMYDESEFTETPTAIRFDPTEGRIEGEPVSNQYLTQGVTFDDDAQVTPTIGTPQDCANGCGPASTKSAPYALFNSPDIDPEGIARPLTISFTTPQTKVGMYVGNNDYGDEYVEMKAYDSTGELIFTAQRDTGTNVDTFIGIHAGYPRIASVEILNRQLDGGAPGFRAEEIDDLLFEGIDPLNDSDGGLIALEGGPGCEECVDPASTSYTATVKATDEDPNLLKASFFAVCTDLNVPLAVGLSPTSVSGNEATFDYEFDAANICVDGVDATIMAIVNDGFLQAAPAQTSVAADDAPPVAVVSEPASSTTLLEHASIGLSGAGFDLSDGVLPSSDLQWFLSGPGFTDRAVASGSDAFVPSPALGWDPGSYEARLVATDSNGNTSEKRVSFLILKDNDNDGVPVSKETCAGGTDANPFDAFNDGDLDGFMNAADDDPCAAATSYEGSANFDPDNLFVPSSGNPVTITVRLPNRNLGLINASSVRIDRIGARDVSQVPGLAATSWSASGNSATAKFDRQILTQYLADNGYREGTVRIGITGSTLGSTWTFHASSWPRVHDH
jgi:hypothetical protein